MVEELKPLFLDETGQSMKESMDSNTEEMKSGLQAIADALKNTEALQNAKAEIQAEGAAQVESVTQAAQNITDKAEQIQQNTDDITELKGDLDELDMEHFNLFNKAKVTSGKRVNPDNGNLIYSKPHFSSDYINVSKYQGSTLNSVYCQLYAFYDSTKSFISGGWGSVDNDFTINVPLNATYIIVSGTVLDEMQVGTNVSKTSYIQHDLYKLLPLRIEKTQIIDLYNNVITVGSDEEFTSITSALNSITDATEDKRYTIFVKKGTYEETFHTKDYVDIVGENKWNTIINFTNSEPSEQSVLVESTIWAMSNTLLKNLTISTTGTKYPIHSDGASGKAYRLIIEDCVLIHNGIFYDGEHHAGTGIGIGLYQNQHIELRRCYINGLPRETGYGASCVYCHNQNDKLENSGYRSLTIEHCILNSSTYGIRLQAIESNDYQDNDVFLLHNQNNGVTPEYFQYETKDSWHVMKFD